MGRRSNAKSWLTGSQKQEKWVAEYLLKKKITWDAGLTNAASRSSASAIDYLKGLDESISDNKLLLQQASSAWRAQKSRKDNKQINISISENSYNIAVQLAKSNGYSIKAMVDFLIAESQNKIEELERLKEIEPEYTQARKSIEEQDTQIEELGDELLALKKQNDALEQELVSLKQEPPLVKPLVLAKKSESSALRSNRKEVRKKRTYAK